MTTLTPTSTAAPNNRRVRPVAAHRSPPKHSDRTSFNEKAAAQNAQGDVQDKQVEHLHQLG